MVIIVMGVSGAGKSTIGKKLATALGWQFAEGDERHPAANIEKLRGGIPLTEQDRKPWLLALREDIQGWLRDGDHVVLAASVLRRAHRDLLLIDPPNMRLVYLKGSFPLLKSRLLRRGQHFMHPELLGSQFETLEEPQEGVMPPAAIIAEVTKPPDVIVEEVRAALGR
jgi:gluconokinase